MCNKGHDPFKVRGLESRVKGKVWEGIPYRGGKSYNREERRYFRRGSRTTEKVVSQVVSYRGTYARIKNKYGRL